MLSAFCFFVCFIFSCQVPFVTDQEWAALAKMDPSLCKSVFVEGVGPGGEIPQATRADWTLDVHTAVATDRVEVVYDGQLRAKWPPVEKAARAEATGEEEGTVRPPKRRRTRAAGGEGGGQSVLDQIMGDE